MLNNNITEMKAQAIQCNLPLFLQCTNIHNVISQKQISRLIDGELDTLTVYQLTKIIQHLSYSIGMFDYWICDGKPITEGSNYYKVQQKVITIIEQCQNAIVIRYKDAL